MSSGNDIIMFFDLKSKFTLHDLIVIACLSAIGLAIKPIINPMIHIISGTLRIPGGSLSGGFLMMWMVLARVIVNKPGAAFIFGLAQGLTVMLLGFFGSHGVFSIISYSMPGLMIELFAVFFRGRSLLTLSIYCIVANMTGTALVALVIMQLPILLLVISVLTSIFSGMLGGWFSEIVLKKLVKYTIVD
jgi:energy-coupling factor transport system substrate-specific component